VDCKAVLLVACRRGDIASIGSLAKGDEHDGLLVRGYPCASPDVEKFLVIDIKVQCAAVVAM
jgi:hypothetical protein